MHVLWLTLADPEPRHNGQFVYSGGLIDAVAAAGAEVAVLALERPESPRRGGMRERNISWRFAEHDPRSRWASVASRLPHLAHRSCTRSMRRILDEFLDGQAWDSIVFDGISVGWALRPVQQRFNGARVKPKLVYISHNHEESLRARVAENQSNGLRRLAVQMDALKVTCLERSLVDAVDMITAITPEDGDLYRARRSDKHIDVLTPGYCGRRLDRRSITEGLPRRAVVVGSFDWIAKRMNLEEFVNVADPIFATAGAELQVVGSAEESFLDRLRKSAAATEFTGPVQSVSPYLDQARVAVVPERSGGGFKLKVLEYVFNRMPILALNGSVSGVPLNDRDGILLYRSHEELAKGILAVMDDVALLNRMQERAYTLCRDEFSWSRRGQHLLSSIASL
jgi:polysaccharide biosynthesis protein PslH